VGGGGGWGLTLEKRVIGRSKHEYAASVYSPDCLEEEFPEVGIAPVQLLGVFPEEIGRLAVALRALDAVP
jgi:hypothetical protein